jgi:hypothetical protein
MTKKTFASLRSRMIRQIPDRLADPKRCCDLSKSTLQIQQINLIQMATNPPYIILQQAGH